MRQNSASRSRGKRRAAGSQASLKSIIAFTKRHLRNDLTDEKRRQDKPGNEQGDSGKRFLSPYRAGISFGIPRKVGLPSSKLSGGRTLGF